MADDTHFCIIKNGRGSTNLVLAAYVYQKRARTELAANRVMFDMLPSFQVTNFTEDELDVQYIPIDGKIEPFSLCIVELTAEDLNTWLNNT